GFIQLRDLPTQLTPVRYPADWYAAATYLGSHVPESAPVVVLPWHLYVNLPFTERLTANPARVFFPGNLLTSNDPELIAEGTPPPSPGDIGNAARNPTAGCRLAGAVRSAGARWVLLEAGPDAGIDLPPLLPCGLRIVHSHRTA